MLLSIRAGCLGRCNLYGTMLATDLKLRFGGFLKGGNVEDYMGLRV